jgi:multimeric flavodoxin WrbA
MKQQGKCVTEDDMAGLLNKFLVAKAIVVASPNYYYTVSGLMKNMIDRSISLNYRGI